MSCQDYTWDMNEQVMYWIAAASHRPEISEPMCRFIEANADKLSGGLWMLHNYVKQARFDGRKDRLLTHAFPILVSELSDSVGKTQSSPGSLHLDPSDGKYHVLHCGSPEYRCYEPFESLACTPASDCNYELSQLRWGLQTVLELVDEFGLAQNLTESGVNETWWRALVGTPNAMPRNGAEGSSGLLVWYPFDAETGFKLDEHCEFKCPQYAKSLS